MSSSYRELVARAWQRDQLMTVLFELTYRCNLDCFVCYNDRSLRGRPLAVADYQRVFGELAAMQVLNLTLSGGEPLSHPSFFAIAQAGRENGFLLRIKSNGHAINAKMAARLKRDVDPHIIDVSLHGACAETHDRQTRVPGSFERLCRHLRGMREAGLRVKLNAPMTRWNEAEIEAMYALAADLGLSLQVDPEITERDDGDRTPLEIAPSREGLTAWFALQRRQNGEAPVAARPEVQPQSSCDRHCAAGGGTAAVDPVGTVFPCVQWRRPIGNVHDESFAALWAGRAVAQVRAENRAWKQQLAQRPDGGAAAGFCPGVAEARGRVVYESAVMREETHGEARRIHLRVLDSTS